MKRKYFWIICFLLFASRQISAQLPPPPRPVIETEIRDNSIRMRSVELERIKREAEKPRFESNAEREIRFARVKEDFENIQKLQDTIVKVYTRSKKIDYGKINNSAAEIVKNSFRLGENLFGEKLAKPDEIKPDEKTKPKKVPDLIVALDNAIGEFVRSPIFRDKRTIDRQISEKAEKKLREIIDLSGALAKESAKLK